MQFLDRIAVLRTLMRSIVRDRVAWSVCLSVGPSVHTYILIYIAPKSYNESEATDDRRSVTLVSPAKTAEPIEVPFGLRT